MKTNTVSNDFPNFNKGLDEEYNKRIEETKSTNNEKNNTKS